MLKIGDRLDSYTLAAGEPWIMSVQMRSMIGNAVLNWSQRRLVLSFYDVDRTKLDQIDGVYSSDATGAYLAFIRDGRFSEGLYGKAVQVELAERLQDGRSVIATGALSVVPSSLGVTTYGTIIGRVDARFSLYFNTAGLISLIEQELLPYASASVPPPPTVQTPAAINSDGTPQVGEQLTGVDPVFQYASITRRRWLNGSTALATTSLYTPTATGALTWSVDGLGDDGSPIKSESTISVAAATPAPTPTPTPTPVGITGTPPSTGQVGAPYSFTPGVTNGSGTKVFALTAGVLLGGLSFSTTTGAITGAPNTAGTMSGLVVRVSDTTGSASTTATDVTIAAAAISSINAEGWSAEWTTGTPPTFAPDVSPQTVAVTRQGFDATGAATTYSRTRTFTRRKRLAFPDYTIDMPKTVALDDYVYSTDTIAGVTNNSAEISPKPGAAWVLPDRQIIGNALPWEAVAFHRDFQSNRQVACVVVTASDGTNSVSQTVASTVISTAIEDANPVEVYRGTLDITGLNAGLITLNAKVYPWIGGTASVLNSADSSVAREFSPRYYTKNVARAAAPPIASIRSTGNDTTGVWSTNPATARATPFASLKGALDAVNDSTRGTPATGGIVDGCEAWIWDSVNWGGNTAAAKTQNSAAFVVKRDPTSPNSRSATVLTLTSQTTVNLSIAGLTSPLTETALHVSDISWAKTADISLQTVGQVHAFNMNYNHANGSVLIMNTAHTYFYGVPITNVNAGTAFGQVGAGREIRMLRGIDVDMNGRNLEQWVNIGCTIRRSGAAFGSSTGRDWTKGAIVYGNRFLNPTATVAPITMVAFNEGDTITGNFFVQNLVEMQRIDNMHCMSIFMDSRPGNSVHTVIAQNTFTGYGVLTGRNNQFYDESPGTIRRSHRLIRDVGNIYNGINTKGDIFVGVQQQDTQEAPSRTGQLAYVHGVGCEANWSQFQSAGGPLGSSFAQLFPGIASNIGPSTSVRNDPLFVNYQATGGAGGTATAGAGGGNYRLQAGSPARGKVTRRGLAFDLAGAARPTSGTDSMGAYA